MAVTRVATAGTYNSGDIISAADINAMPGGTIGRDTLESNSAGSTGAETVMSCSPAVGDDREITIHVTVTLRTLNEAENGQVAIFEDGVQIQRKNGSIPGDSISLTLTTFQVSTPGAAATHTYDVQTGVSGTGGEVIAVANGGSGTHGNGVVIVQDTGPAF